VFLFVFIFNTAQKKEKINVLRTCFCSDPRTLDTRKASDYISSQVIFMLYRGLMHYNSKGLLELSLAKSYEISENRKKYIFHLKENIFWSDGKEIVADDFEKSWKKILDPSFASLNCELLFVIKNAEKAKKKEVSLDEVKIKALDSKTLEVELENPNPHFLFYTSFFNYFPYPSHVENKAKFENVIVSGPFKLKKWKRNNEIVLQKNPFFYNKDNISLEYIHISIIPNENTAFQMYEEDELDLISSFSSPLTIDTLGQITSRKDVKIIPVGGFSFLTFNIKKFPFNNLNLRKAFSCAINRLEITQNITQLNEQIATRYIPPIFQKQNKLLIKNNDIKLAQKYFQKALKELKIEKDKLNIAFIFGSYDIHKKEAEVLKQMWEKAFDIKINLNRLEDKVLFFKLQSHKYQLGLARLLVRCQDPIKIFERFKYIDHPKNYSNWENENFRNILDQANLAADPKKREQLIELAEKLFLEEMPITPLYFYNNTILSKKYIKGVYTNIVGDLLFDETKILK